ncbi:hypothetical protein WMW72_18040 [Paenibacillus filicis]|uniref:LysM domain-containing protein n=1 Tax=Paenibacillus filicis TaxID=669464 RepID=A0ABU9DPX5_9BACL
MNRAFTRGGFGFRPPFRPFPHPFFPGRFLFPYFFSPFYYPFFRSEEDPSNLYFAQHQAQAGESLDSVGHRYNIPATTLEVANHHISNPDI